MYQVRVVRLQRHPQGIGHINEGCFKVIAGQQGDGYWGLPCLRGALRAIQVCLVASLCLANSVTPAGDLRMWELLGCIARGLGSHLTLDLCQFVSCLGFRFSGHNNPLLLPAITSKSVCHSPHGHHCNHCCVHFRLETGSGCSWTLSTSSAWSTTLAATRPARRRSPRACWRWKTSCRLVEACGGLCL